MVKFIYHKKSMYLLNYTIREMQILIDFLNVPKIDLFMKRFILWVFVFNVTTMSVLYVKFFIINKTEPMTMNINRGGISKPVLSGVATEIFIQNLKSDNLDLKVVSKVKREQFTVDGRMVTVNADNFQVFEYPNSETATKEASVIAQKYISSSRSEVWKKNMHVYASDKIVVFYMGNEETIIKSLDKNAGISLMKSAGSLPIASKAFD